MSISFGADPVTAEVTRVLELLRHNRWNGSESALVDLKEEAGRRGPGGVVLPGSAENETAADQIAGEAVCMANTPGSGALVIGVADDGQLIGTNLDVELLRHRVFEKTDRQLTIDAHAVEINNVRLLVVTAPEAIEPIRWRGKVVWRVADHCVEVDPATWHSRRMLRQRFDWSAQASTTSASAAREASVDVARRFLRASSEARAADLAGQSTPELLRRLNVVDSDGLLTNAGVLAFVGRGAPGLDYIRRDVAGGDSRQRLNEGGRGLFEELADVLTNIDAHNSLRHVRRGPAAGQVRDLPDLAVREAVVNGLAHREWGLAQPTLVEHVGRSVRVTSPGGFFGGVNPSNIITHPSESRNRALTELLAAVRIAEREGVGVDRMVREMLRLGHPAPDIYEIDGPYVRTALVGDAADEAWITWLGGFEPAQTREDVNALIILRLLVDEGWVDVRRAVPLVQLDAVETAAALHRLAQVRLRDGVDLMKRVRGVPEDQDPAWALTAAARGALQSLDEAFGTERQWPSRERVARTYSRARGRISTTELGSLVAASATNVGGVLKNLEQEGHVLPSRPTRRGAGFYYVLATE